MLHVAIRSASQLADDISMKIRTLASAEKHQLQSLHTTAANIKYLTPGSVNTLIVSISISSFQTPILCT